MSSKFMIYIPNYTKTIVDYNVIILVNEYLYVFGMELGRIVWAFVSLKIFLADFVYNCP